MCVQCECVIDDCGDLHKHVKTTFSFILILEHYEVMLGMHGISFAMYVHRD